MYQPRGTRTRRRLQEFRQASQARRALALAQQEPPRQELTNQFSIIDALMGMAEEPAGEEAGDPGACPACGGPVVPLGVLGRRAHSRCRDCGLDLSHEEPGDGRG